MHGFADVLEQNMKDKNGSVKKQSVPRSIAVEEALYDLSSNDKQSADLVKATIIKQVGSMDLMPLRIQSMADQVGLLRNEETIFRNILEANPLDKSTDFQIRIRERKVSTTLPTFFAIDGTLPAQNQSAWFGRTNTMGAYGNTINITWFAQELAGQSPVDPTDERAKQVEDELVLMRFSSNAALLTNTEVTNEGGGGPQWGGFTNRSTSYNVSAGGGNLTDTLIQGRVNAIANGTSSRGMGFSTPLVCLTTAAQIAVVRNLMIARYPGETSTAYLQSLNILRQRLADVNVPEDLFTVYKPDPGRPILFIHEPQMSTAQAVFFDPRKPQIAKMQMMGQLGPFVVERPTSNLVTLLAVFDVESLVDPIVESRAMITSLAS